MNNSLLPLSPSLSLSPLGVYVVNWKYVRPFLSRGFCNQICWWEDSPMFRERGKRERITFFFVKGKN